LMRSSISMMLDMADLGGGAHLPSWQGLFPLIKDIKLARSGQ
jgi:hypothetical protein